VGRFFPHGTPPLHPQLVSLALHSRLFPQVSVTGTCSVITIAPKPNQTHNTTKKPKQHHKNNKPPKPQWGGGGLGVFFWVAGGLGVRGVGRCWVGLGFVMLGVVGGRGLWGGLSWFGWVGFGGFPLLTVMHFFGLQVSSHSSTSHRLTLGHLVLCCNIFALPTKRYRVFTDSSDSRLCFLTAHQPPFSGYSSPWFLTFPCNTEWPPYKVPLDLCLTSLICTLSRVAVHGTRLFVAWCFYPTAPPPLPPTNLHSVVSTCFGLWRVLL